ncbi:ATP-binding cassette domain-containing protein [Devosia sp. A449]
MEPLLEIDDLRVMTREDGTELVHGVSLTLQRGRILGVVGESGSGKTLSAMTVAGLLPNALRAEGRIRLDGVDLPTDVTDADRAVRVVKIGIIFQNPSTALNPRLTIGAQLEEALAPETRRDRALAANECLRLLTEVGMTDPLSKLTAYPHELSGGLAQRAVIAMALARKPVLLIADEPTTALDVTIQAQILDLVIGLQQQHGFGVLLITHDMGVVRDRTQDVIIMAGGRVVEAGTTEHLFQHAQSPVARALLQANRLVFGETAPLQAGEPPLLQVSGLCKTFGRGLRAVGNVNLTVAPGQSIGIVGESGSGKTTLARIIAGLQGWDSGSVMLDGAPRRQHSRSPLIQYVFQDPYSSLDPRMAIVDIVAEPLQAMGMRRGPARDRASELLAEVGLDRSTWYRPPGTLSGGQRQRVGIARAIAPDPQLLISDEPVASLDATVREQVLNLLLKLQSKRRMAQLLISHDLSIVTRLCSHVIVMKGGEIVEQGEVRAIFENSQHPYTRLLLDAIPGRANAAEALTA